MAKIVVFLPQEPSAEQAYTGGKGSRRDVKTIYTAYDEVLSVLETERSNGAMIAVARGSYASLIRSQTDMPLSEICMTGQEMLRMVCKAQKLCDDPHHDLIAFVGDKGMFSDTAVIADALEANIGLYCAETNESLERSVQEACQNGAKVIVGGTIALSFAQKAGVNTLFLEPMQESIQNAIETAKRILFGIEIEQKRTREFMSLLNHSFDAILKLDSKGNILLANFRAEAAFGLPSTKLQGQCVYGLISVGEGSAFEAALRQRKNIYGALIKIRKTEYMVNFVVLDHNDVPDGAILTMQEIRKVDETEDDNQQTHYSSGHVAHHKFRDYQYPSSAMTQLKDDAQTVAQYNIPILITGVYGTDKVRLAESIHNASMRSRKPFVRLQADMMTEEMLEQQLLVSNDERRQKSVFELAHQGTLLIENIDKISHRAQILLMNICSSRWLTYENGRPAVPVDCRMIATATTNLIDLVRENRYSRDLCMEFSKVILNIPSLHEREADIEMLIDEKLACFTEKYKKFIRVKAEAKNLLMSYDWLDDEMGMGQFIENLVLLSTNYEIDESIVKRLFMLNVNIDNGRNRMVKMNYALNSVEEAELQSAMVACHGNRTEMAQRLGISKTTLWRKMKRYSLV